MDGRAERRPDPGSGQPGSQRRQQELTEDILAILTYLQLPAPRTPPWTETKSKRIRHLSHSNRQRTTLKLEELTLRTARCYNETVAHLRKPGTVAHWKNIKFGHHLTLHRNGSKQHSYQVKSIAVRDACRAVTRCKKANAELAQARSCGERLDEPFAENRLPKPQAPRHGSATYLGAPSQWRDPIPGSWANVHMAEALPIPTTGDESPNYSTTAGVSTPGCSLQTPNGAKVETTRRRRRRTRPRHTHLPHLVLGNRRRPNRVKHDFGRIQRLCPAPRPTRSAGPPRPDSWPKAAVQVRKATDRMRVRIRANLIGSSSIEPVPHASAGRQLRPHPICQHSKPATWCNEGS